MRAALAALVLLLGLPVASAAAPVRAAYFYNYQDTSHLDSLAAAGFDRALIHWITDSLGVDGTRQLDAWADRGMALGVDLAPEWLIQAPARLSARPADRRYTWGPGRVESSVACPLDSAYWRSAFLDRAEEFLGPRPGLRRVVLDLELSFGSTRHHYDAGPCACPHCLDEYTGGRGTGARAPWRLAGLLGWEEGRVTAILTTLLTRFAAAHPGVEVGVLDLDLESFVHRGLARALARTGVPTADYSESTYAVALGPLPRVRSRLARLGLGDAPLYGGLWLKRFTPRDLPPAVRSVTAASQGYFVFTTFSLWQDPAKLTGPYTLLGAPSDYWRALREANAAP